MGIRPTFYLMYGVSDRSLYNFESHYSREDKIILPPFIDEPTIEQRQLLNNLWGIFTPNSTFDDVLLNSSGFFGLILESTRYSSKLLYGLASLDKRYSARGNIAIPSLTLEQDNSEQALNLRYAIPSVQHDVYTQMKLNVLADGKNYEYFWDCVDRWNAAALWLFESVGVHELQPIDLRLMICWTWD